MKNQTVELLRGIAAILIVGVHVVFNGRTGAAWLLHDYCDVGVALFAALSGFLMPQMQDVVWGSYVKNRARRLLVPYAIWSVVFILASIITQWLGGEVKDKYKLVSFWLSVVFEGNASTHLWFLIWLFYIQCLLVKAIMRMPIVVIVLLSLLGIMLGTCYSNYYVDYPLRLLSFVLVGCGFRWAKLRLRCRLPLSLGLGAALCGTFMFGILHGNIAVGWLNLMMTTSVLALIAFCDDCVCSPRIVSLSALLGGVSMGIYLVHPLFSVPISRIVARLFTPPYGLLPVTLSWFLAYAISMMAVELFRRVIKR